MNRLWKFQQEDIRKLRPVESRLIGNEMGTGKTYEAIELDRYTRGRTLVVAPLSTLHSTWEMTYRSLIPGRNIFVINPRNRNPFINEIMNGDPNGVFITHWESLRLNGMEELSNVEWEHVIGDEIHRIRNRKTQQTRALKKIPTWYKTGLTGTPVVKRPDDLWSILNWLYPKKYSSYWKFYNRYVDYTINYAGFREVLGAKNTRSLMGKISPFYVRRLKQDVMSYLPPKYYSELTVPLGDKQRKAYNQMRKDMLAQLDNEKELVAPTFIAKLVRLQQLAGAYYNGEGMAEPSAKADALMDILDDASRPVVVFSALREMIGLVENRLNDRKVEYSRIVGEDSPKSRLEALTRFASGEVSVFLGTIGAGSEGISLVASDTCVFLDRAWTPAENWQAEDRLHRGGQENAVQVININAENTIDQYKKFKLTSTKSMIRSILQ